MKRSITAKIRVGARNYNKYQMNFCDQPRYAYTGVDKRKSSYKEFLRISLADIAYEADLRECTDSDKMRVRWLVIL
jgi:hypothetical protein